MRLYAPRKITAKHMRQGIELLECPDCGALIYSRMLHDAWHATVVRDRSRTAIDAWQVDR